MTTVDLSLTRLGRTRDTTALARIWAVVAVSLPRCGRWISRSAAPRLFRWIARSRTGIYMHAAGAFLSASAWGTFGRGAGLAAIGASLLVLDVLSE